jgi:two-component system OmpR family response regulator
VVEDSVKMAGLLKRGLQAEGYSVDVAANGADAVWMATERPTDAVVLDVMLPDVDGFEVLAQLRAAGSWTPVLLLTARKSLDDRVRGLDVGADDYLTKPFAFSELAARLRALVRRGPSEPPAVLRVGDLALDPATRIVRRGDADVALTPKEFSVLEFFMRHAGEVVTRMQLLDHCWDFAYDGSSNVVDVYVNYLRDKIDRPFNRSSIDTVRGAGDRGGHHAGQRHHPAG